MRVGAKLPQIASLNLGWALEKLSKAALIDIIVDRAMAEITEHATEHAIADHIQPWVDTVLRIRGDKAVKLTDIMIAPFNGETR